MTILTERLKTLLGAEEPKWIDFMDEVALNMPFLFDVGRPTSEQIESSEIGAAGCKSWRDYVTRVLGWKFSAWEAWRRAYKLVQSHAYLRDIDPAVSVSAVNKSAADNGTDNFPASLDAWSEVNANLKVKTAEKKALSLAAANKRVSELEAENEKQAIVIESNEKVLDVLRSSIESLNAQIEELKAYKARPWYKKIF